MNADFQQPLPPEGLEPDQRVDLFLCHPSTIKPIVRRIATKIRAAGMSYWLDEQHKPANDDGIRGVSKGLERADILVAFINRQVLATDWVMAELESRIHRCDSYVLVLVDYPLQDWQNDRPQVLAKHPLELSHGDDHLIQHLKVIKRRGTTSAPGAADQSEILRQFEGWSRLGQGQDYAIQGRRLSLPVVDQIVSELGPGVSLLEGGPGAGKSGALREVYSRWPTAKLFLKMDLFLEESPRPNLSELARQAEQLARTQPVALFVDSLDVLSLHRQSRAFRATLELLDSLHSAENVSVLVACRRFDRTFDPSLKARSWNKIFALPDLNYADQVEPLLLQLPCPLPESRRLQELLKIPQNLGLYVALCQRFPGIILHSAYDLYEEYLANLVDSDPKLGQESRLALQRLAAHLQQKRCHMAPQSAWAQPHFVQPLVSLNILRQPRHGWLGFSHQTWLEFLGVRAALDKGESLAQFILSQDQLPFCRPFVRAYFQQMVHVQSDFLAQIREVIESPAITFHLKRLLVVDLAHLEVEDSALPFLHFLSRSQAELMPFFLQNFSSQGWLVLLRDRWLDQVWHDPDRQNQVYWFLGRLDVFAEGQPALVLSLTMRGLSGSPSYRGGLRFLSLSLLKQASIAKHPQSRELMQWHLIHSTEDVLLGDCLATWLGCRGAQDEDLLWTFLALPAPGEGGNRLLQDHSISLPDGFLASRFASSPELAERFLQWLVAQHQGQSEHLDLSLLNFHLLHNSSWAFRRHDGDMHPHNSLVTLLMALQTALCHHAEEDSDWWRAAEHRCAGSPLEILQYLRLHAISQALPTQVALAELILHQGHWFQGHFFYEWTELCKVAYPYLTEEQRQDHQHWLVQQESRADVAHAAQAIYGCYRSPEIQLILDETVLLVGPLVQTPPVRSGGGFIGPPFGVEQIHGLSDSGLLELFNYFQRHGYGPPPWADIRIGGKTQILQLLHSAASVDPDRFFRLLPDFEKIDPDVYWPTLGGLGAYFGYNSGRVQPGQAWKALSYLEVDTFCTYLLTRSEAFREHGEFIGLLRYCSYSSLSNELSQAVVRSLPPPAELPLPSSVGADLQQLSLAYNSPLGEAVEVVLEILLEQVPGDQPIDTFGISYLEDAARRDSPAIQALILRSLPNLIWYRPETGWPLFDLCSGSAAQAHQWDVLEHCLYVNYRKHPQRVSSVLESLWRANAAQPRCGEMWGRIRALMVFAGLVPWEELLSQAQSPGVWYGAAHVFATNLSLGAPFLSDLLACSPAEGSNWSNLDSCLFEKANYSALSAQLALAYLAALPPSDRRSRLLLFGLNTWLEDFTAAQPDDAIMVLNALAKHGEKPEFYGDTLIRIFVALLREVDFRNDSAFTRQVIELQDRYVQLAPQSMDKLFDAAIT